MKNLFEDHGLKIENQRQPEYNISSIFINRWSPRAFDPKPVDDNILRSLFEAARWSPSCYNEQPWLFCYATSKEDLRRYRGNLSEFNQVWTSRAPVLGFIFAKKNFDKNNKRNDWAEFDSGAAWMAMTLQARMLGLYTHGMAGFDRDKVYDVTGVPREDYQALAAFAIGRYGDRDALPDDMKENEQPNTRKPLKNMVFEGKFG